MERVHHPAQLTPRAWWHVLRDAVKEFVEKGLMQRAAALAFFAMLSILPGAIVLVALLGVFGHEGTVETMLSIVDQLGADDAVETLRGPIETVVLGADDAGIALIAGSLLALWTASTYMGGFILATNEAFEVEDGRSIWTRRPLQILLTLAVVAIVAVALLSLVLTGPVAEAVGGELGLDDAALTAWAIGRWPFLFAVVALTIGVLYMVAPNTHRARRLRWILPGSILATLLWLVGSSAFSLYVSNFGAYANTYGGLGGAVVFLIWLWISNIALLLGACFSAELERTALAAQRRPAELGPLDEAEAG